MEYNLRTVTKSCDKYKKLRFPLKIWILVNASGNKFLYWDATETVVVVVRDALELYLASAGSIFCFHKLATFFWLMDFNGFELDGGFGEDKIVLQYRHFSFTRENRAYFEQLLRSPEQREVSAREGNCSVHRTKILKRGDADANAQSRLSSSAFAQEKFNLLMEMKSLELSVREAYSSLAKSGDSDGMVPIIEVPDKYCDEPVACVPEYTSKRIVAGNYGRANLEDLKRFFGDYLPVYEDSPDTMESEPSEEPKPTTAEPKEEDASEILVTSSPEPTDPAEPVPPLLEEKPEPINTLETFDYQDIKQSDSVVKCDLENVVPPVIIGGVDLPLPSFENGAEEFAQVHAGTGSVADEHMDEAQFQLYSDIRETFELLNQF
ncbi:uncharacterized protein LOC109410250 [Aedes albopictus]|uniref:HSF-type DNA-binding domain-containing protein n=1 Tax=Aedes albopictus TaxID=7160 RepID=A0ABM2A467_AEDAL